MSDLEKNKQIARDFFAALSAGNVGVLMNLFAPDVEINIPNTSCLGGTLTLKDFGKVGGLLAQACPAGVKLEVIELTAEDDRVACRVNGTAKTAAGEDYNNQYHMLLKIRDGKIYQTFEYMDSLLVEKIFGPLMKK